MLRPISIPKGWPGQPMCGAPRRFERAPHRSPPRAGPIAGCSPPFQLPGRARLGSRVYQRATRIQSGRCYMSSTRIFEIIWEGGHLQLFLLPDLERVRPSAMATPKGTRAQRFLLRSGDAVHIYSNAQSMTPQLRHEVPTEVNVASTSFKVSVVLTTSDALAIAGELLTAAAGQLKPKP